MISKTHIKYIQSLQHKKFRDANGVFIAETGKVILDLLQSKMMPCREIVGAADWLHQHEMEIRKYYKGPLEVADSIAMEKLSLLSTPSEVLAIFQKRSPQIVQTKGRITLVLDEIKDPGNLGTIIRIADWYGIQHIICSPGSADLYNPKVVQSTMGSLGRVNLLYTSLPEWLALQTGIPIAATVLNGTPLNTREPIGEAILIIGNESRGVSEAVIQMATQQITIPKFGQAESLNAAVATGIVLSHWVG